MSEKADSERPTLTVVVPMFDEAQGVAALATALRELRDEAHRERGVDWVLVDDGSRDGTWEELREHFADLDDRHLLRHRDNRGLTPALHTGSTAARGDYVAWLDSDLTYDPSILLELARQLDAGADVACSSCYHPDGGVVGVATWRRSLSSLASFGYRTLTGRPVHTFTSMVRCYRRTALEACWPRRQGFLGVTEVLLRALRQGFTVVETPATLHRRRVGQSKMRVLRVGLGHLGLMAAWVFRRV